MYKIMLISGMFLIFSFQYKLIFEASRTEIALFQTLSAIGGIAVLIKTLRYVIYIADQTTQSCSKPLISDSLFELFVLSITISFFFLAATIPFLNFR